MGEFFVYSFFFGMLFFLLPVFVNLEIYMIPLENRVWFSLGTYRIFRLFGGYLQLDREGVALHISKKKAFFFPFDKMTDARKKFEITQGFQLWEFRQVIETGGLDSPYCVLAAAAIQSVSGTVFSILQTQFPFVNLKNSVLLRENAALKITVRTTVVFNGLVIAIAITKKILEAIINWIRKKRSTRFSKKQPNSSRA